MSVLDALKGVLKLALIHDGLARGLREASKALDRRQAHMCVLNENCEEEAYKKLVVALCGEHNIPLIKVPDGKALGEWAGLCKFTFEGSFSVMSACSREILFVQWNSLMIISQAYSIVKEMHGRLSTALVSWFGIGVKNHKNVRFCLTTSKLSSRTTLVEQRCEASQRLDTCR